MGLPSVTKAADRIQTPAGAGLDWPIAAAGRIRWLSKTDALLLVAFIVLLGFNIARYYPFYSDDSLISLRYSQRLLEGKGLTWSAGERVEGYTNLLWVLGVAFVAKLGFHLILASRILGVLCTIVSGFALLKLPIVGSKRDQESGKLAGALFFALAATPAAWAIGGLEQPLVGACLSCALLGTLHLMNADEADNRVAIGTGVSLALLCLTRPDSPIFVAVAAAALAAGRWLQKRPVDWKIVFVVAGLPLAATIGQVLFRHAYYGEWITNTARVKFKPSPDHLRMGLLYLYQAWLAAWPLYVAAILSLGHLLRRRQTGPVLLLGGSAVLWTLYVAMIGGDIFPTFRHSEPVVIISVVSITLGFGSLLNSFKWNLGVAPIPLVAGALAIVQIQSGGVRRAEFERFEWQGRAFALTLKHAFGAQKPVMAVTAAGCLPYWTKFDCIDMLGLNDAYIAKHPPKTFGTGWIGHEMGNPDYVWSRRPDLIVYNVGTYGDAFLTGQELCKRKEFLDSYAPVTMRIKSSPDFEATTWVNRYSPGIGFARDAGSLTIPGYFADGDKNSRAVADPGGRLVMEVTPVAPAQIVVRSQDVPARPYAVSLVGDGKAKLAYELRSGGDVAISVKAVGDHPYFLRQIVLKHQGS